MIALPAPLQAVLDRRGASVAAELLIGGTGIRLTSQPTGDLGKTWPDDSLIGEGARKTTYLSAGSNQHEGDAGRITALESGQITFAGWWTHAGSTPGTSFLAAYRGTSQRIEFGVTTDLELVCTIEGATTQVTFTSGLEARNDDWFYAGCSVAWFTDSGGDRTFRVRFYLDDQGAVSLERRSIDLTFDSSFSLRTRLGGSPLVQLAYLAVWSAKFGDDDFQRVKTYFIDGGWGEYRTSLEAEYRVEHGSGADLWDYSGNNRTASITPVTSVDTLSWVTPADPAGLPWVIRRYPAQMELPGRFGSRVDLADAKSRFSGPSVRILDRPMEPASALPAGSRHVKHPPPVLEVLRASGLAVIGRPCLLRIGSPEIAPDDWQPILIGRIASVDRDADGAAWTVRLEDATGKLARRFRIGRKIKLHAGISASFTGATILNTDGKIGRLSAPVTDDPATATRTGYLRIDDEIIGFTTLETDGGVPRRLTLETITRGEFGTAAASHATGAECNELFRWPSVHAALIAARLLTQDLGQSSVVTPGGKTLDSTELLAELGDYSGSPGQDLENLLPRVQLLTSPEFSLASVDDVLDALTQSHFTDGLDLITDSDIDDVGAFVQDQLLRTFRGFLHIRSNGQIGMGLLDENADPVRTLDYEEFRAVRWRVAWDQIVNELLIEYGRDAVTGDKDATLLAFETDSQRLHGPRPQWSLDSDVIEDSADGDDYATDVQDRIFRLLADPPPIMAEAELPLRHIDLEMGDVIEVTSVTLPDTVRAVVGVYGRRYMIVGRQVDQAGGHVRLSLLDVEAFGGATIKESDGIASEEALGTPLMAVAAPTGVASAEAFGGAAIAVIAPAGIASDETFGTATLNVITDTGAIASGETFGAVVVAEYDTLLAWGGRLDNVGNYWKKYGYSLTTEGGTAFQRENVAPRAFTLLSLAIRSTAADATTDVDVEVNGASVEVLSLSAADDLIPFSSPIAVAQGDTLAVLADAGTAPASSTVWLHGVGGGGGAIVASNTLGGNFQPGENAGAWGDVTTTPASAGPDFSTEHSMPAAGNLVNAGFYLQDSAPGSWDLEVSINGASAEIVTVTTNPDAVAFSAAFSQGDTISLGVDSGSTDDPFGGGMMMMTDIPGIIAGFGADITTPGHFLRAWGHHDATRAVNNSFPANTDVPMPFAGTAVRLGWSTDNADANTDYDVHKNGASAQVVSLTGAAGTVALSIAVARDDDLGIQLDAHTGSTPILGTALIHVTR